METKRLTVVFGVDDYQRPPWANGGYDLQRVVESDVRDVERWGEDEEYGVAILSMEWSDDAPPAGGADAGGG